MAVEDGPAKLGATGNAGPSSSRAKTDAFWTSFNARIQDVTSRIEKASDASSLEAMIPSIGEMRSELTSMTDVLPSYDRSAHEANLTALTTSLQKRQAELRPKKAFAFKRKPKVVSESSPAEAAASSPAQSSSLAQKAPDDAASASTSTSSTHASLSDLADRLLSMSDIAGLPSASTTTTASLSTSSLSDLHLSRLASCVVDLRSSETDTEGARAILGAIQVRDVKKSLLLLGHIQGSIMLHEVQDCLVVARCRQFRMHRSTNCTLLLCADSVITIEDCEGFHIASLSSSQASSLSISGMSSTTTTSPPEDVPPLRVQDFSHVHPDLDSPHWSALSAEEAAEKMRGMNEAVREVLEGGKVEEILSKLTLLSA